MKNLKKNCLTKTTLIIHQVVKELGIKSFNMFSKFGINLEVDLEYPKELHKLHNNYTLAPDKLEMKKEKLSDYQLKIADGYNISIGNVKNLVRNFFDKERASLQNFATLFKT